MEDFIAEIYEYAQLIPSVKEEIRNVHGGTSEINAEWNKIQELLVKFCQESNRFGGQEGTVLFDSLSLACKSIQKEYPDRLMFGDLLEDTIDKMYDCIALWGKIDVTEGKYRLFSSKSGFLSVENIEKKRLYHSSTDPMWEAFERAERLYRPECLNYNFLGCGLGYLPLWIYYLSDCSATINIFHTDEKMIEYAFDYGVLSWIPENKLQISVVEAGKIVSEFNSADLSKGTTSFVITDEILEELQDNGQYDEIREQYIYINTRARFGKVQNVNFYRNIHNVNKTAHIFKTKIKSNKWIVVTGGPSLDEQMEFVNSSLGKRNIVCPTTVLKKLLSNGIRPDCAVVLDPQERTFGHLAGIENESIPLIMNVLANWRFGELYKGEKYLIPSVADTDVKEMFESQNLEAWNLGATVSNMAIEVAVRLGAEEIDLVGLDLSYPSGKTHAGGTMDCKDISTDNMVRVESVDGKTVPTTNEFMVYISDVKERIKNNPQIKFINYSNHGAKFEGSVWYKDLEGK